MLSLPNAAMIICYANASFDSVTGVDIKSYSAIKAESEILFLPGTRFHVKNQMSPAPQLTIINLEELPASGSPLIDVLLVPT